MWDTRTTTSNNPFTNTNLKQMKFFTALVATLATASASGPPHNLLSADYTFEQYKLDHGKTYASPDEHAVREKLFNKNLSEILGHNSKEGSTYKKGVNEFTDTDFSEGNL